MTILRDRNDPKIHIKNYFAALEAGIAPRGISFSDIDAIEEDWNTGRFLVREFKHEGESMNRGQRAMLCALSRLPEFTVWGLMKCSDGRILWFDYKTKDRKYITEEEWKERYARWWNADDDVSDFVPPF